jgi:glucuronosyltransferase
MWLLTGHEVLEYAKPMMPNMVSVGGLTLKRSLGELPEDLKSFIEGAEKGVILVSFGSMVTTFPTTTATKFLDAFKRLNGYRFVWRLINKDNIEIPDNVMIMKWLPQNDLLAHPKIKLFITHSGNNGQFEALYHGVPMLGFPLLGDQEHNAARLSHKGYGIHMNIFDFTSDELFTNIRRLVDDVSFKERISKASEIFRSDAMNPIEKASFWIEHVCKFGSEHLSSGGQKLPLYAYFMLDILAFVLVVSVVAVCFLTCFARFIWRKIRLTSNNKQKVT